MSSKRRFFINGILLTLVGISVRTVAIGFNSFVTRAIGAEGIGLFSLIGSIYAFAVTFASAGISLTVTKLVSAAIGEGREDKIKSVVRSSVMYALIFSVAASVILFAFARLIALNILSDGRTVISFRILSLSLVPLSLSSVFSGYFIGVRRVGRNAITQVLCQVVRIVATVLFVTVFSNGSVERGTAALCLGITVTELSVFLIALLEYIIDVRRYSSVKEKQPKQIKNVASMALPLAFSAYIRSLLLTLEHTIIPKRLTDKGHSRERAVSLYGTLHGMALPVLLYPMVTLSSFAGLLVPEFSESLARGEYSRMKRVAERSLNTTLAYAILSMTVLFYFSEEIGYLLYNSSDAGYYISFMCFVVPIMYLDHVTDAILKGIGEQVYSMWVNISDSLLSVALVWVLIGKRGILGYALVIVIMEGYNFLLSFIRLHKRISFRLSFLKSIILPLLSSAMCYLITAALFAISGRTSTPVWLFMRIIFMVCVFVAVYLLTKSALDALLEKKIDVNKGLQKQK